MKLSLCAAHPAAAPDTADEERRKWQECEGIKALNSPTSEMNWREKMPSAQEKTFKIEMGSRWN